MLEYFSTCGLGNKLGMCAEARWQLLAALPRQKSTIGINMIYGKAWEHFLLKRFTHVSSFMSICVDLR
jgi:hypothetical protein